MIPSGTLRFLRIWKLNIVERIKRVDPFFGSLGFTIGNFDGFHLGHRRILKTLSDECRNRGLYSAVITFKEHPLKLIRGEAPRHLGPRTEKIRWFQKLGVDILFYIDFDMPLSGMRPLDFLGFLKKELDPGLFCLGRSFRFGKDNIGDVGLIEKSGTVFGYDFICVDDVRVDGDAVSSTRIRKAVDEGNFTLANRLLGRNYSAWLSKDESDSGCLMTFLPEAVLPREGRYRGKMLDMKTRERMETTLTVSGQRFLTNSISINSDTLYRFFFEHRLDMEK